MWPAFYKMATVVVSLTCTFSTLLGRVADRHFQRSKQENIFPFTFIDIVGEVPEKWHKQM